RFHVTEAAAAEFCHGDAHDRAGLSRTVGTGGEVGLHAAIVLAEHEEVDGDEAEVAGVDMTVAANVGIEGVLAAGGVTTWWAAARVDRVVLTGPGAEVEDVDVGIVIQVSADESMSGAGRWRSTRIARRLISALAGEVGGVMRRCGDGDESVLPASQRVE